VKSFTQKIIDRYDVYAMANLSSSTTGVDGAVIWVSVGEFEGKKSEHNARIKVVQGTSISAAKLKTAVIVTITDEPEVLHGTLRPKIKKDVIAFITINKKTLLAYWNGKIDTFTFIHNLISIKK
jgi:hypothetical protein